MTQFSANAASYIIGQQFRSGLRLFWATATSLALHVGILAISAGDLGFRLSSSYLSGSRTQQQGQPAPLHVTLSSYRLVPAKTFPSQTGSPPYLQSVIKPLAPVIQDSEFGDGGLHPETPASPEEHPGALGLPVPTYFSSSEVSIQPQVITEVEFDTPELTILPGAGKAILVLYISETGGVDRIEIESTEVGNKLTRIALQQFAKAVFRPAMIEQTAVKSRLRIEVLFRPLLKR
jgi:hypothetical protein